MIDNGTASSAQEQALIRKSKTVAYVLNFVNNSLYGIAPSLSTFSAATSLTSSLIGGTAANAFSLAAFSLSTAYSIFKNKEVELDTTRRAADISKLSNKILNRKFELLSTYADQKENHLKNKFLKEVLNELEINKSIIKELNENKKSFKYNLDALKKQLNNQINAKQSIRSRIANIKDIDTILTNNATNIISIQQNQELKKLFEENKLESIKIPKKAKLLFKITNSYMLGIPAGVLFALSSILSFSGDINNKEMIGALTILSANVIQGVFLHIYAASNLRINANNIANDIKRLQTIADKIEAMNSELKNQQLEAQEKQINSYPSWLQNLEKELASHNKSKAAFRDAIINRNKNQQELSSLKNNIARQQSELNNIPVIKKKLQEFFQEILKAKAKYSLAAIKEEVAKILSAEPYEKPDIKVAVDSKDEKSETKETELFDSYLKDFEILSENVLKEEEKHHIETKKKIKEIDKKLKKVGDKLEDKQKKKNEIIEKLAIARKPIAAIKENIDSCATKDILIAYIGKILRELSPEIYSQKQAIRKLQKSPTP